MKNVMFVFSSHYSYNTYDKEIAFSSDSMARRAYDEEYDWYCEACEEYGAEPECYDD